MKPSVVVDLRPCQSIIFFILHKRGSALPGCLCSKCSLKPHWFSAIRQDMISACLITNLYYIDTSGDLKCYACDQQCCIFRMQCCIFLSVLYENNSTLIHLIFAHASTLKPVILILQKRQNLNFKGFKSIF